MIQRITIFGVLILALMTVPAMGGDKVLTMSTTTSTQSSGPSRFREPSINLPRTCSTANGPVRDHR